MSILEEQRSGDERRSVWSCKENCTYIARLVSRVNVLQWAVGIFMTVILVMFGTMMKSIGSINEKLGNVDVLEEKIEDLRRFHYE
jgi:hypothetical protein